MGIPSSCEINFQTKEARERIVCTYFGKEKVVQQNLIWGLKLKCNKPRRIQRQSFEIEPELR
jgi:hypothetical protein